MVKFKFNSTDISPASWSVSYGVLKKFERTGQISLISILKIALILKSLEEFKDLFSVDKLQNITSLDQLLKEKKISTRKRGRK